MKKVFKIAFLLLTAVFFMVNCSAVQDDVTGIADSAAAARYSSNRIRVASFNIQIFGPTKVSRANVLWTLAHIATRYDVIAVQEVGSNGHPNDSTATAVMNAYINKINQIAGPGAYSYVRGHQYAFVYKNSSITKLSHGLYNGWKNFTYKPLQAYFRVKNGNFDFGAITIHTSPSKAENEIGYMKTAMYETKQRFNDWDVIALGDFNADGSYYSPGPDGGSLSGWSTSTYTTIIKNGTDTTVSTYNDNTYDRIQAYNWTASQWSGASGVLRFADHYNISNLEGTSRTAGTEKALSDHYPVWAEFYRWVQ